MCCISPCLFLPSGIFDLQELIDVYIYIEIDVPSGSVQIVVQAIRRCL